MANARLGAIDDEQPRVIVWLDSWAWLVVSLAYLDAGFSIVQPADFRAAC